MSPRKPIIAGIAVVAALALIPSAANAAAPIKECGNYGSEFKDQA